MRYFLNYWFNLQIQAKLIFCLMMYRFTQPTFYKFLGYWFGAWLCLTLFALFYTHHFSIWKINPLETTLFLLGHCVLVAFVLSLKEGCKPCTIQELEWCHQIKTKTIQNKMLKQVKLEQIELSQSIPKSFKNSTKKRL